MVNWSTHKEDGGPWDEFLSARCHPAPEMALKWVSDAVSYGRPLTCSDSFDENTFTGTVNQNVEPACSSEMTPIAPFIKVTSCLQIDSPSPVPPIARVLELSAWTKGTNNRSTSLGESPIPVSLTWAIVSRILSRLTELTVNFRIISPLMASVTLSMEQSTLTSPFGVN